ncbi:NAD(P)/FAD-dependent oxidoreductase [Dictyobacter arantiisoli]|uniref:NADH:ubiquinone reductase (non-electrogenic) n=1 Tax=Dictyobacter arantiisoli TaxID=2014874 RepID=A0A5A5T873_9CHLR|nr:NAD(P)/FAD-dependent oxidoreductase [Dictyobacter arantiisoli]GCF07671.1 NADH dehydrogenase [Dictyobacter arantiisoli]
MDTVHVQSSPTKRPQVVIVGAGFAGLNAAKALKDAPVDVTVIDRNNHHLFQPLLYQVATAVLSPADISAPIRSLLRKQKNTRVVLAEVTGIDRDQQCVLTADGREFAYDYIVVATGASHSYFGNDQWAPYAPGMKTIADATALRRKILLAFEEAEHETDPERQRALLTFILIGAGPTGVEMAGAVAELAHVALAQDFRNIDPRSARIILVEALPRILPVFDEGLAKKAQEGLHNLGVEVRTGSAVEEVNEHGVVIAGKQINATTVIWTAGVSASPAGKWLGAETDRAGRAKVDQYLNLPGYPNIFIVGDTCAASQDGKPIPGIAPAAMQGGLYAASVIIERVAGKPASHPFHYHNRGNLATVGRSFGIADLGKIKFSGFPAWLFWILVHIMFLVGFRNRFLVLFQSLWGYITFQRGARLITHDGSTSVRQKQETPELLIR